jgi:AraC-like DNA-binding protein
LAFVAPTLDWSLNIEEQPKAERHTRLSDSAAQSLATELKDNMETHQWYTQPDFSLTDLAKLIGMSTHDVSEVLNLQIRQSFYEFVNNYRVELACQQLKADAKVSATDIGFACGFNSKSAFYNAFKKFKQTTPAQFRLN